MTFRFISSIGVACFSTALLRSSLQFCINSVPGKSERKRVIECTSGPMKS